MEYSGVWLGVWGVLRSTSLVLRVAGDGVVGGGSAVAEGAGGKWRRHKGRAPTRERVG